MELVIGQLVAELRDRMNWTSVVTDQYQNAPQ